MCGSLGRVTERRGMSGILIIGYPSGNRSDNEPGSVFTKRAAEAGVGGMSRQNENLGKKSGRYGGEKRRKTKLQFASHGRSGPQSLLAAQIRPILLTLTSPCITELLSCSEAGMTEWTG